MEKPEIELKIKIKDTEFTIKYLNSGSMIDLAVLKAKLSDNQYTELAFQRSNESSLALRLIDTYAFFTIALPQLKNHLLKQSLYDLETEESLELIHIYNTNIEPWLNKWTEYLNSKIEELKGNKNTGNSKNNLV